jgi:hypothetical protein
MFSHAVLKGVELGLVNLFDHLLYLLERGDEYRSSIRGTCHSILSMVIDLQKATVHFTSSGWQIDNARKF